MPEMIQQAMRDQREVTAELIKAMGGEKLSEKVKVSVNPAEEQNSCH